MNSKRNKGEFDLKEYVASLETGDLISINNVWLKGPGKLADK